MKLLSTMITTEKETTKEITVCVDDQTAMVLEQCTEEFRHMYILEEYEDQKLTHTETRRIVSYCLIFVLMLLGHITFKIYYPNESFKEGDYGKKINAIHLLKWVIAICFVTVNIISLFIDFQYYWPKFLNIYHLLKLKILFDSILDIFYPQLSDFLPYKHDIHHNIHLHHQKYL